MKEKTTQEQPQEQPQEAGQENLPQQPKAETLVCPFTLNANSREELFTKFEQLKADNEGITLAAGAVGKSEDGTYLLRVDTI